MNYLPYIVFGVCAAITAIAAAIFATEFHYFGTFGRILVMLFMVFFGLSSVILPLVMAITDNKK